MENNPPFEKISHCSICQILLPLKALEYEGTHLFIAGQEATIQKNLKYRDVLLGTNFKVRFIKISQVSDSLIVTGLLLPSLVPNLPE